MAAIPSEFYNIKLSSCQSKSCALGPAGELARAGARDRYGQLSVGGL